MIEGELVFLKSTRVLVPPPILKDRRGRQMVHLFSGSVLLPDSQTATPVTIREHSVWNVIAGSKHNDIVTTDGIAQSVKIHSAQVGQLTIKLNDLINPKGWLISRSQVSEVNPQLQYKLTQSELLPSPRPDSTGSTKDLSPTIADIKDPDLRRFAAKVNAFFVNSRIPNSIVADVFNKIARFVLDIKDTDRSYLRLLMSLIDQIPSLKSLDESSPVILNWEQALALLCAVRVYHTSTDSNSGLFDIQVAGPKTALEKTVELLGDNELSRFLIDP